MGVDWSRTFRNPEPFAPAPAGDVAFAILVAQRDAADYPVVADFCVQPLATGDFGAEIAFVSESLGPLTDFGWWPIEEIRWRVQHPEPPLGTPAEPFADVDQGISVVIWRADDWVYVLTGDDLSFASGAWYRVPADRFATAWLEGIERAKALIEP